MTITAQRVASLAAEAIERIVAEDGITVNEAKGYLLGKILGTNAVTSSEGLEFAKTLGLVLDVDGTEVTTPQTFVCEACGEGETTELDGICDDCAQRFAVQPCSRCKTPTRVGLLDSAGVCEDCMWRDLDSLAGR